MYVAMRVSNLSSYIYLNFDIVGTKNSICFMFLIQIKSKNNSLINIFTWVSIYEGKKMINEKTERTYSLSSQNVESSGSMNNVGNTEKYFLELPQTPCSS